MTKQAKLSRTDGLGQWWSTCVTPHFCLGHVFTVMDLEDTSQALVKWITLDDIAFVRRISSDRIRTLSISTSNAISSA